MCRPNVRVDPVARYKFISTHSDADVDFVGIDDIWQNMLVLIE